MKIGLLGWDYGEVDKDLPVILEVGKELGHEVVLFVLDDIEGVPGESGMRLSMHGHPAESFDIVLSRAQLREASWRPDVERLFLISNVPGLPILDPASAFIPAESKLGMMQKLGGQGLPVPPSCTCRTPEQVRAAWERWERIVLKGAWGYGGFDVFRVLDFAEQEAEVQTRLAEYGELLCQPFYDAPGGDVRITIFGDRPVFNVRRTPQRPGEWRANLRLGGRMDALDPTPEMVDLAVRAARAMGVTMAGVDLLDTTEGFKLTEVNNVPGGLYCLGPERQRAVCAEMYALAERTLEGRTT